MTDKALLGKSLFFDPNLSINENHACAAWHGPTAGWTGPDETFNAHGAVYEGSIPGRFGARKPPSSAYATQSPIFHMDKKGLFVGGHFWDGRATGEVLGNPAADQAQASPFINPVEQALPSPSAVVEKVCVSAYVDLFRQVWGADICDPTKVATAWDSIALSIANYEASPLSSTMLATDKHCRLPDDSLGWLCAVTWSTAPAGPRRVISRPLADDERNIA